MTKNGIKPAPKGLNRHETCAYFWCRWNGQTGTKKQIERMVKFHSEETLDRMLQARGWFISKEQFQEV